MVKKHTLYLRTWDNARYYPTVGGPALVAFPEGLPTFIVNQESASDPCLRRVLEVVTSLFLRDDWVKIRKSPPPIDHWRERAGLSAEQRAGPLGDSRWMFL
jgi:hypothetical protein